MAKSYPRKIILALVLLVPLFILGGCSSKYVVTFDTTPQGADQTPLFIPDLGFSFHRS